MVDCRKIEKEALLAKMKCLEDIYDVVRLVEPESTSVLMLGQDDTQRTPQDPCFSVWDKTGRCANCISLRACMENHRFTKFEFRDGCAYTVVAIPYLVQDGEKQYKVSLELVNRVQEDLVLEADGLSVENQRILELNTKLYQDSVTGAYNRRYYDEFRYIYEMTHTMPKRLGYLVVDVNNFAEINAKYGHVHGDDLLVKVADLLRGGVRATDRVMRLGSDEFLIVMRDCNQQFMKKKLMQLKSTVAKIQLPWLDGGDIPSIAVGMAFTDNFNGEQEELRKLYHIADAAMYEDKKRAEMPPAFKSVLVVSNAQDSQASICAVLQKQYAVYRATNDKQALQLLETHPIDLILIDETLEGLSSCELIKAIKENRTYRDIAMLAVTDNTEAAQKQAIEAGADLHLDRPFSGGHLLDTVQRLTGHDHGRRELFDIDFVLETIPGAVIVYKLRNDAMEIVSCSRGIQQLSGWEADEFCNRTAEQFTASVFPADVEEFTATLRRLVRTHSRAELFYRVYKKDGSLAWVWFQARYIGEENGCPILEAILLDISSSSSTYQAIIDESDSAVIVANASNYELLYTNKKAQSLIGLQEGEYIGKTCYNCVYHRDEPCENCIGFQGKDLTKTEFTYNGMFFRRVSHRIVWNGMDAYLSYTTDISAEKENIAYAEKQKTLQSNILNNIPVGIMVYCLKNGTLTAIEANAVLCDMMVLDKKVLVRCKDADFLTLVHKEDQAMCKEVLAKLSVPGAYVEYEFRSWDRRDKKYIWMGGRGCSELQPDGSVYIYLAFRNVSERKELEATQQSLMAAQKTAEAKAEFYSRMSHDMRTPMNGILGIAELAKKDVNAEAILADLDKIGESGRYMLQLINDTLDYQRIESGRLALKPEVIHAGRLVADSYDMLKPSAEAKGVKLIYDVTSPDLDGYIRVDGIRLKQVFINIISNAIKFTPEGGTVLFKLENQGTDGMISHEKLTVSDTGVGMSRHFIENDLYKPFSQETNALSAQSAGSGLGLSIVKNLVDQMQGRIEVDSEPGNGTTFTVYLDIERVSPEEAEKYLETTGGKAKAQSVNLAGKRILLCEDHPLNAEIVKRMLARVDVQTDWARNGAEGVQMFESSAPGYYAAILMDIRMPCMDGLTAAEHIRAGTHADAATVPILAMSANAYEDDVKKSLAAGMNAHLAKPVNARTLYDTLAQYWASEV